jgi:hypothetical protein
MRKDECWLRKKDMTKTPWHHGGPPEAFIWRKGDSLAGSGLRARDTYSFEYLLVARTRERNAAYYKTTFTRKNIPRSFDCACQRKENDISHSQNHTSSFLRLVVLVAFWLATTCGLLDSFHMRHSDLRQFMCSVLTINVFGFERVLRSFISIRRRSLPCSTLKLSFYILSSPPLPFPPPRSFLLLQIQRHKPTLFASPFLWSKRDKGSTRGTQEKTRLWV